MKDLSPAELRLELAEAEAIVPRTIVAGCRKRNRLRAITRELIGRGSF